MSKIEKYEDHWYLIVAHFSRETKLEIVVWNSHWHCLSVRQKEWDRLIAE